jgi:hypothetical protein
MDLDRALRTGLAGGLGLGLLLTGVAGVSAQTADNVSSDGAYVVADDDGDPNVSGGGTDIVYGDVATGGTGGEVLGDPNAVYYPDLSAVPGAADRAPAIAGIPIGSATAGNMIDGIDFEAILAAEAEAAAAEEAAAAPVEGEAVAVEGEAAPVEGEAAPVEGEVAPVEGEAVPVEGEAAPVG